MASIYDKRLSLSYHMYIVYTYALRALKKVTILGVRGGGGFSTHDH